MVHFCAVFGCSNRSNREKDKSYFRLPSIKKNVNKEKQLLQEQRRNEWLKRIRRDDLSLKTPEKFANIRICSDHFISGEPSSLFHKENPDWAPSEKLGHNSVKKNRKDRHERYLLKEQKRLRTESAEALLLLSKEPTLVQEDVDMELAEECCDEPRFRECSTQTDLTIEQLRAIEMEVDQLRQEYREVKQKLKETSLDEDSFKEDNEKVKFYTGLPSWQVLYCVFNFVVGYLPQSSRCILTPFQRLLLTLMRMRLNLSGKDLAYRFGAIHETTVSRIFLQVLDVLHLRLSPLIRWPSRDELLKTLPMDFRKNCPACVVIIDCFEIFLERATNPLARAQTYSNYKHHNTVKYLIGITPQGSVSFISEGWGGRVSDKHLTEESGLLEKLIPGDVILADRGFDIQESVGLYCARIKIPAFTKGKKQLSGIEVEQTRRIANVRIHVERVIGNIRKKYGILSDPQPIDFAVARGDDNTILDKIVTVSCALINLCDSVVPFE